MEQQVSGADHDLPSAGAYNGPDPEDANDLHLRLMLALGEAGHSGRLSWVEVDHILTIVERYSHLANAGWWAVYISLGGECPTCQRVHRRAGR